MQNVNTFCCKTKSFPFCLEHTHFCSGSWSFLYRNFSVLQSRKCPYDLRLECLCSFYFVALTENWLFANGLLFLHSLSILCSLALTILEASWRSQTFFNFHHAMATFRLWLHSITRWILKFMAFSLASFRWLTMFTILIGQHPWHFSVFYKEHSILLTHFLFFFQLLDFYTLSIS